MCGRACLRASVCDLLCANFDTFCDGFFCSAPKKSIRKILNVDYLAERPPPSIKTSAHIPPSTRKQYKSSILTLSNTLSTHDHIQDAQDSDDQRVGARLRFAGAGCRTRQDDQVFLAGYGSCQGPVRRHQGQVCHVHGPRHNK